MSIVEEVKQLVAPVFKEKGVRIYEITYGKEGKDFILRILVEKENDEGISLDEIVDISETISPLLDEADIIKDDNYMLDVASAGAEHPIDVTKLDKYINRYVNLHLINPIAGENIYEGTLSEIKDDDVVLTIRIKTRTKNISINRSNIDRARLAIKF